MALTSKMMHYTTLSPDSKVALQSGDITKMLVQLKKLQYQYQQRSAHTAGSLRRHMTAMKNGINQHVKQLRKLLDSSRDIEFENTGNRFLYTDSFLHSPDVLTDCDTGNHWDPHNVQRKRETLNQRWMRNKMTQKLTTKKKAKTVDSLNQTIYKHYYQKLSKLTKMTVDPVNPSYMKRSKERSDGLSPEYSTLSYQEKFRILLYKVNLKWKPRDYVQRKCDYKSLFSRLCSNIMDCIRHCTSDDKGGRLDSMDRLDNLFRIMRRFKISSPKFRHRVVYRGGGPKKRLKGDNENFEYWGKQDVIGKDQLSAPVVDSLSAVLKTQFSLEHGLLNVSKLYRASRISGPVSQRLNRFNLVPVSVGVKAVQIHYCNNHYVTSEQRPSGIVVWDSLQTSDEFKMELYPQLRLTYDILSQYSEPPKGLIKYLTDSNNMQQDISSCGIYAVLRAYSILHNTHHKINVDVARSYLSEVLENRIFTDYDMFSSRCMASKMKVMMDNYMCNQKQMHTKKLQKTLSHTTETLPQHGNNRKRGRPPKRLKNRKKTVSDDVAGISEDIAGTSVRKPGRPAMYSPEEMKQRVKDSKLKHYHKSKGNTSMCKFDSKMKDNPEERFLMQKEKHKHHQKVLRSNIKYREREKLKDKEWKHNARQDPAFRENEKRKERKCHRDNRADPVKRKEENQRKLQRKYGSNEQDAITKYLTAIQSGPNVVCSCCLQLWFPDNCTALEKISFPNAKRVEECKTGTLFEGKEWLCSTCIRHLKEDRIPPISHANGMKFLDIPEELLLVQMEERCVALRQPFFQIRELPNGGQKSIKGNVVNVPMDVSKTINQLPRNLHETETIGIKFQKKISYKKCDYYENIRPHAVIKAAKYLIANSELYQAYNVKINDLWQENSVACTDDSLRALMGIQGGEDTIHVNGQPSSEVIEIDLTVSDDDDVISVHSTDSDVSEHDKCEENKPKVTIIHKKKETSDMIMDQMKPPGSKDVTDTHDTKGINISDDSKSGESDDNFSEVDEMDNYSGNMDTMLDRSVIVPGNHCFKDKVESSSKSVITDADALVIAPGEGQRPISLFNDPDAEYLAFPSIYCGKKRPIDNPSYRKTNKRPSNADIYKWELRAQDRRVATCIPNIFFKVKCLQTDTVENVVGISVRKVQGKMQPTAGELKTSAGRDKLRNLHEGVNMFRKMRNTPPYYSSKKKSLLAMVRQGGMPALFFTQSCADTRWPELLKILGKLVDNKDYSDTELDNMSYIERNRLVAADPVTVVRYFENKCHQFQKHIMNLRGSYKHFLRREFQHRGSPHSHEIHWIKGAPIYDPDKPENDKNVINFIDNWISTEVDVQEEERKYLSYQIHKHSRSCRKKGEAICRFGIPFFPMEGTAILKPLEDGEVDQERLQLLKDSYQELRKKLNEMGEGSEISHKQFLVNINMSQKEYLLTIRSSLNTAKVFYKRKPNALRVNPYMSGMLSVIRANHDVQYPLNIYALVSYVADYLLKSQKGLSATLEQACIDVMDGDMKLKQQIRHIGYQLLSAIETGAPEACYYIMQIPFTRCSVEVVFIPTSPPEERTYVLKSEAELSELPEDSRDVLKSNVVASYAKRPRKLQPMCLADYVAEITVQYHKYGVTKEMTESDDSVNIYGYDEHDEDIVSDGSQDNLTVPEGIFPLETLQATFKKRRTPRVIRFVNYNRTYDPENYYRERLLLYMPWRKEELLKGKHDTYAEAFHSHENVIKNNMHKYEKFTDEVREAEELIHAAENDGNFDNIAPNTEQSEREDELLGTKDSTEYGFFRPPKHSKQEETITDIMYNAGIMGTMDTNIDTMAGFINEEDYLDMVSSLNEKQFQIYTHILQHISSENSQPLQVFITGGAGVGKSMVLRCVYQGLLRLLSKKEGQNPEAPRIIIAAPTGKAAYLVDGNTIHSLLKILPSRGNEYIPLSDEHKDSIRIKFKNLNTIIIDEVSMVGNNMLKFIHLRLQEIMGCYNKMFGGLNVILFGDLFQLRPVMDGWIFEELAKLHDTKRKQKRKRKLTSAAALAPNIWKDNFTCFELTEVMRQKDDQLFCDILNRMREGKHTKDDVRVIKQKCELKENEDQNQFLHIPHFYHTNSERNIHNQRVLLAKEGQSVCVHAIDICTQTNLPKKELERIEANVKKLGTLHLTGNLETELQLKVGLPYDMTTNVDTEDGLCNGTSLVLKGMLYLDENGNIPSVLLVAAEDIRIGRKARNRWKTLVPLPIRQEHPTWIPILSVHSQYMYLLKHPIKREQFPLTLAAGKTFHKSQGSSLKQAIMAFPEKKKIEHLHYVGLSRVTEMSGIKILHGQFHEDKIHVHEGVKAEMSRLRSQAKLNLCFKPLSEIISNFLVVSFNAQSLHKHIGNVKADWNMKAAMAIGICETRIKQGEDTTKYEMNGFEFHHIEQLLKSNQRPYHGVALYVKKEYCSKPMFFISTDSFECISRDIFISNTQSHIQVIMCYKKPGSPNELLLKFLKEIVKLANPSQPLIIMGDFNINKQQHTAIIAKMSQILQCRQIISDVTTKANTCIDLVFTNMNATEHGSIFTAVSHHHLTYAAFENVDITN